ncbi:hypothetical protein EDD86DRAFT_245951 [Gorgonomyces haynaldii]|nr:hypothetical protein EDD86DRAFT_245951 [Gorgonomyces haynaldii]
MQDWEAAIFSGSALIVGTWIAFATALWNVAYPPFKSKQLITQSLGAFGDSPAFSACALWSVWITFVFGTHLMLSLSVLRLYRLYLILVKRMRPSDTTKSIYLAVALSWLPCVCAGIVSQILPSLVGTTQCWLNVYLLSTLEAFVLLQLILLIYINSLLSTAFNEYLKLQIAYITMALYTVGETVIVIMELDSPAVKIVISFGRLLTTLSLIWAVLFSSLYGFLFQREQYLERWRLGLHQDNIPRRFSLQRFSMELVRKRKKSVSNEAPVLPDIDVDWNPFADFFGEFHLKR